MVVLAKRPRSRGSRRRRVALLAVPLVAVVIFLAGALAQQSGALSGLGEILDRVWASFRNPRDVIGAVNGESLPKLRIDVNYQNWQKIEAKRREALNRGLLVSTGDDFVPATVRLGGKSLRAKIRLKGDILDHVVTSKWSLRIHLRGNDRLRWREDESGMRRFSIQHPKTRFFLREWAFLETMRYEEILAPRYGFVRVRLNGKRKGIYALEEAFARELMESQQRREGLLLRLDEDPFHRWFHDLPPHQRGGTDVNPVSDRNVAAEPFDGARVESDPGLRAQWARARHLLESFFHDDATPASRTFDAPLLGRYLAICELWGAIHPLRWGNVRFHYNPLTDRIEPVAYDGNVMTVGGSGPARLLALGSVREGLPGMPWTRRALRDRAVAEAYLATLERILSPAYLDALERRLGPRWRSLATTLGGEFPGEPALHAPWPRLRHRAGKLARALSPNRHVLAFTTTDASGARRLEAASVLVLPVEVVGLLVGGRAVEADVLLPGSHPDEAPRFAEIPLPETAAGEVVLVTRILGQSARRTTPARPAPLSLAGGIPPAPEVAIALGDHPFLERAGERTLRAKPGTWDVDGDLVLPAGFALEAGPGTTLRFAKDAIFVARGPLRFCGTEDRPVVLRPREERWAGLAVLDALQESVWNHVRVRGTAGVARGGWTLTSGVTFHRSPVSFSWCSFLDHRGLDDQLNVFRSKLVLRECELGDCSGDALDGDFVDASIVGCSFHDVEGDAVDFSGSRVEIEDLRLRIIKDKGVSAGEASRVEIMGLSAEDVAIGIAAKDLSHVLVRDSLIRRAKKTALAAYRKKPEFGPGVLEAADLTLEACKRETLVQTGSRIELNGRRIDGSARDDKLLYEESILGD